MSYSPYQLRNAWLKRLAAAHGDVTAAETVLGEVLPVFRSESASGQVFLIEVVKEAARASDKALVFLSSLLTSDGSYDANEGDPYAGAYWISVRGAATGALSELGARAFPEIRKYLRHGSSHVHNAAVEALQSMPQEAIEVVPELLEIGRSGDATVRASAVRTLGKIAAIHPATATRLEALLDSPSVADRLAGVLAYDYLPRDRQIERLPRLIELFDDSDFRIKEFALNRVYVLDIPSAEKEIARERAEKYLTSFASDVAREAKNLVDSLDRGRRLREER